ncbi:tRNA (adenosine(37)-N6)-threonylcarbamoyltransferase complex dimerization subunit type 1 TsaB [Niallia sp. NCCP-28]|uniref:tRNA (adenosine(37)-N6)-threonylcarbamoyltransferase complex dimerization subunit type 1 TsaB n=1 Tax=Niallia sp. NCCP-28 TaxID=2934712 RepID=UPI00208CEEFC|nr:tRNA (adenosine(37)-N6)-threonylcarbamoyltransferase complex dimerization subunit type 1 TsaB [Niallia sp. NCCP-28]GKU85255.1 tRNA (adenosine(37)-N6)-threonylcarbamoyltransferase complex dimerization subunit type 1 TsaB [Niallia sp. NCCP-28]
MKVLAIDTSNFVLGISILDNDKIIGEYVTNLKKNHSVRAMPAIEQLMRDCDVKPKDLTKIVVANGPGSYTGVRIGVTIAKTLAWTLQIPLVGISSLEVLAASVGRYYDGFVSPIFDARRGQIYTGLYRFSKNSSATLKKDQLILTTDWIEQLKEEKEKILFVGNDVSLHQNIIASALLEQAQFAHVADENPRPAVLAVLGSEKEGQDIHSFTPNYIRLAEAEANWLKANKGKKEEQA